MVSGCIDIKNMSMRHTFSKDSTIRTVPNIAYPLAPQFLAHTIPNYSLAPEATAQAPEPHRGSQRLTATPEALSVAALTGNKSEMVFLLGKPRAMSHLGRAVPSHTICVNPCNCK